MDQPAESGRDDPFKTQSGGILLARSTGCLPVLPRSAHRRAGLEQDLGGGEVAGRALPRQGELHARAVGLSALPGRPAPLPRYTDGRGRADRRSAGSASAAGTFRVTDALRAHKDEYLDHRTDHHWTTLGLYDAYEQFCEAQGLTPFDRSAHPVETAENFYGTHYSKARTWNAEPDTITWYDLQNRLTIWNVTAPGRAHRGHTDRPVRYGQAGTFTTNTPCSSTATTASWVDRGDGTGKILVIKDSYANSFVPYLTANYAAIDVVDFRNYNYGLDQLIADNDYDAILVLYSYSSFTSDPYLYRAAWQAEAVKNAVLFHKLFAKFSCDFPIFHGFAESIAENRQT